MVQTEKMETWEEKLKKYMTEKYLKFSLCLCREYLEDQVLKGKLDHLDLLLYVTQHHKLVVN